MLLKMGVATIGTVISVRNRPSHDDGVSAVINHFSSIDCRQSAAVRFQVNRLIYDLLQLPFNRKVDCVLQLPFNSQVHCRCSTAIRFPANQASCDFASAPL